MTATVQFFWHESAHSLIANEESPLKGYSSHREMWLNCNNPDIEIEIPNAIQFPGGICRLKYPMIQFSRFPMLRTALLTSATLIFATGAALAEGGNAAPPPPPVIVAQTGFEGLYAGVELGLGLGGPINDTASVDPISDFEDGSAFGVFVGYNWQRDNLVFGGDLRYLAFDGITADAGGMNIIEVDNVIDLRGRLGFDAGDTLFYGAVGYSLANATDAGGSFDMDGFNYGLGVEYNLNEDLFVGLDYTGREVDGTSGAANYESSLDTLTLRLGLRF